MQLPDIILSESVSFFTCFLTLIKQDFLIVNGAIWSSAADTELSPFSQAKKEFNLLWQVSVIVDHRFRTVT